MLTRGTPHDSIISKPTGSHQYLIKVFSKHAWYYHGEKDHALMKNIIVKKVVLLKDWCFVRNLWHQ